jgi:hypothetical protein
MHFFLLLFMNGYLIAQIKLTKQKFQKGLRFGLKRRRINRGMVLHEFLQRIPLSKLNDEDNSNKPPRSNLECSKQDPKELNSGTGIPKESMLTIPTEVVSIAPVEPALSMLQPATTVTSDYLMSIHTECMMDDTSDHLADCVHPTRLTPVELVPAKDSVDPDAFTMNIHQYDQTQPNDARDSPSSPQPLHSLLSINDSFDIDLGDVSLFLENDLSLFQSNSN